MTHSRFCKLCDAATSLGLLLLLFFVLLSLATFHVSDPPSSLVWPNEHAVQNWMGICGSWFSGWMFEVFGLGVWYILLGMLWHSGRFFLGLHAKMPFVRFSGWCLSVIGFCGLVSVMFPGALPFVLIGSGGYTGAAVSGFLASLGPILSGLVLGLVMLAGFCVYSDYVVPKLMRVVIRRLPKPRARRVLVSLRWILRKRSGWHHGTGSRTVVSPVKKPEEKPVVARPDTHRATPETLEIPTPEKPAKAKKEKTKADDLISIHRPQGGASSVQETIQEQSPDSTEYVFPPLTLLAPAEEFDYGEFEQEATSRARLLETIVSEFGFRIKVREIQLGPVITQYQVELESGIRVAKIANLADDLAVKLGVANVRIVFPILGKKNLVGVEIPNVKKQWVRLREVMEELAGTYSRMNIPIFLGKDVAGKPLMTDLTRMPHLLIAGRTGTGKSVCLNSIITSILMTRSPKDVRMLMVDPKMVELSQYKTIPHLMHPVVTDMKKAEAILGWAVEKMEERYRIMSRVGTRNIEAFNHLSESDRMKLFRPQPGETVPESMPYIVIVVDEMADLIMTSPKEVESHIIRLAQKSRAVGIHLILATQKPIVSVITSLIKSNLPARIAFQVSSKNDSRVVLDENGADRLLGNGDMLFLLPGTSTLVRAQGTFLSDDEINRVVGSISTDKPQFETDIERHLAGDAASSGLEELAQKDELYLQAIDIIVREKRGSISLLQRMLGIGYGRAARLIDYMEEDGIVGAFCGYTKPREVKWTIEEWEAKQAEAGGENVPSVPAAPSPQTLEEKDEKDEDENDEETPNLSGHADDLPPWDEGEASDMTDDEISEEDDAMIAEYLERPREKERKKREKKDRSRVPPFLNDGKFQEIKR
ncbi:MAG: DNA translocase FtsK 4TM domain-containing protein [Planctomycetia bacterium]|nr:DNA translocase FtsK 4TM domain-containing protein [Planctomycetia bacterium]